MHRLKLRHANILQLRYLVNKTVDGFCSQIFKSYLFFDFILTDLKSEIAHRKEKQAFFAEEDLLALLKALISGLIYFQQLGVNHNCLRSSNIYIS